MNQSVENRHDLPGRFHDLPGRFNDLPGRFTSPCFRVSVAVFACLLVGLSASSAQQMPDPSQMAGRALPAPELAAGTVSVRLFRERVGNNIVNHPVTLTGQKEGPKTVSTDEQGRAQFA